MYCLYDIKLYLPPMAAPTNSLKAAYTGQEGARPDDTPKITSIM